MNVLALDLGTHTGWAMARHGAIESGAQTFDLKRGESQGMRYLRFNRWLDEIVTQPLSDLIGGPRTGGVVQLIAYEQPHHRGGAATEIANGFATRVQECCARLKIEHAAVPASTLKKWTTGKGNAEKDEMRVAVAKRWNRLPATDDEADAIALLYYALATWGEP